MITLEQFLAQELCEMMIDDNEEIDDFFKHVETNIIRLFHDEHNAEHALNNVSIERIANRLAVAHREYNNKIERVKASFLDEFAK